MKLGVGPRVGGQMVMVFAIFFFRWRFFGFLHDNVGVIFLITRMLYDDNCMITRVLGDVDALLFLEWFAKECFLMNIWVASLIVFCWRRIWHEILKIWLSHCVCSSRYKYLFERNSTLFLLLLPTPKTSWDWIFTKLVSVHFRSYNGHSEGYCAEIWASCQFPITFL